MSPETTWSLVALAGFALCLGGMLTSVVRDSAAWLLTALLGFVLFVAGCGLSTGAFDRACADAGGTVVGEACLLDPVVIDP